jgi:hypothetical protein
METMSGFNDERIEAARELVSEHRCQSNGYIRDSTVAILSDALDALEEARAEAARLREVLLSNRQGYVNILERRKLSSEKWGQRDGCYRGRYGALTREEIEGVIARIDDVLHPPPTHRIRAGPVRPKLAADVKDQQ